MTDLYKGMPQSRWYFWDGGFLASGYSKGVVPPHTHHAIQLAVSANSVFRLRTTDGDWEDYPAGAILPDVEHSLDSDGLGCLLLIDPESREGRWLQASLKAPISAMLPDRVEAARSAVAKFWHEPPDADGTAQFVAYIVRQFGVGMMPNRVLDERVANVIEWIQQMDTRVVSLDDVAKKVFLSPSRFAHLFSDEVGIPFRRYLLWRRLTRAMVLVSRGATLSRAALAAGFSDSAHFTRTFYQMFGIPPSAMLNQGEMFEIPAPFQLARTT
jgi:AraC family transcriptional regulator